MANISQFDELARVKEEIRGLYEAAYKFKNNFELSRQMFTAERRSYFLYCHRRLERLVGPEKAVEVLLEIVAVMEAYGMC